MNENYISVLEDTIGWDLVRSMKFMKNSKAWLNSLNSYNRIKLKRPK